MCVDHLKTAVSRARQYRPLNKLITRGCGGNLGATCEEASIYSSDLTCRVMFRSSRHRPQRGPQT